MSKLSYLKSKKNIIALAIIFTIIVLFAVAYWISAGNGATTYGVKINNKIVGYVSNQQEYKAVLKDVKQAISEEKNISIDEVYIDESQIQLIPEYNEEKAPVQHITKEELTSSLLEEKVVTTNAYAVMVNKKQVVSVASKEDAENVIDNIETAFKGSEKGWKGTFAEDVTISAISVDIDALNTTQSAVEYLLTGSTKEDVYEVEDGDTIWAICERFNIAPEEIEVANPDLDPDNIFIGDEVKLKRNEPFVHYESTGVVTTREPVAFETVEEPTEDLYEGETEVAQEGVLGERDVTRNETRVNGQTITSEEVTSTAITEPVNRVVRVGTKVKPVAATTQTASQSSSWTAPSAPSYSNSYQNGAGIVATAYGYLGVPYVWGGSSPSGFDCSGLVQYVYRMNGINIPRTGVDMAGVGTVIPLSEAVPGDVLGWGGPGPGCYHVAIYIGNNSYIHAPYPGASVSVATFGWFYPDYAIRL